MSIKNWPGGVISPTPVTPAGPYQNSSASGIWTLDQQAYWDKQNLWPTAGSVDPSQYIENIFSTYLYTGNGSTQTITNGIDLSGKGGLVWLKYRSGTNLAGHYLYTPSLVGSGNPYYYKHLQTNTTNGVVENANDLTSFNSNGFSLGNNTEINYNGTLYSSWTFRKQAKFFDVVTYTGNGANRTIAHNLGSVPGTIIIKRTDTTGAWAVYHRSLANTEYLVLNTTAAKATGATYWNSTTPTSTVFSLGTATDVNANTGTYVAYLFAHDAGGFGAAGTDNVISCGSYTGNGSATAGPSISLGYEPQFIIVKGSSQVSNWRVVDNMRGMSLTQDAYLSPNLSNAETSYTANTGFQPDATGFRVNTTDSSVNVSGQTYIYIAIRRGPMRTPTSGTQVFKPATRTGNGATGNTITGVGFPPDLILGRRRDQAAEPAWVDRLRGIVFGRSDNTDAEASAAAILSAFGQDGWINSTGGSGSWNVNLAPYINYYLRRAPGFFDVVCYTGTSVARTVAHNLTVAPELIIVKARNNIQNWGVLATTSGGLQGTLNTTASLSAPSGAVWGSGGVYVAPTASVFTVGNDNETNASTWTYVAYLFATLPGISKVGSYTGTGTTKQIDCGFTAGARFVLIKRTDSTGDWYVWDSARGIVAGNDPYLLLNSTAAEVTNTDYVDTYSAGFEISSTAPAAINANGGTFIFLAIA